MKKMKKILALTIAVLLPLLASAQAQVNTKKVKISDFTEKITKVVLTESPFYANALKKEVSSRWRVSPYEFCTIEEFETLKTNPDYYFLITTKARFKKENAPGLQCISLVKGGPKAVKGIEEMLEIVTIPIASAKHPSGREITFLPAILDIIQNFALDSMESDLSAYAGVSNYTLPLSGANDKCVAFSEDDLDETVTDAMRSQFEDRNVVVISEESADELMDSSAPNTLVSFVVAPSEPVAGSYCYKMLFDTTTHRLYYYRKHKITPKNGAGFLAEDVKRILNARR
ncbi:MAG: hypothetical protein ACI3ZQ_10905 [Candidatus Cryptobacteroides sp.]